MSKRQVKTAASSGRVVGGFGGFGSASAQTSSTLSYIQEPLDYSTLSEPSLGVIFKNLSKKDETTKAKALDDFSAYLDNHSEPAENAIGDLWIRLFPRLSIDNDRRVRQLTQAANGKLCSKLGKRTARYMPQLVGPWLAAHYDGDKAVIRAAKDSLSAVFPDAAKLAAVWSVYSEAILKYCKDTILFETVSTLSDERAVKADDAELVYARTIASCFHLLAVLLLTQDFQHDLQPLLNEKTFSFVIHADSSLRRAIHHFMRSAVIKAPDSFGQQQRLVSNYYVYKGLPSDQRGSRIHFIDTLQALTEAIPEIWLQHYSGKKSAASRLGQFFEKGSQGGPALYWSKCSQLVSAIPEQVFTEARDDLLAQVRQGLSSREDRPSSPEAWQFYLEFAQQLSSQLPNDQKQVFYETNFAPLVANFTSTSPESELWKLSDPTVLSTIKIDAVLSHILEAALARSVNQLRDSIRLSQPEQSQHFKQSQTQLGKQGDRQAQLFLALLSNPNASKPLGIEIEKEVLRLIETALEVIADREGKPYGASIIVDGLVQGLEPSMHDSIEPLLSSFGQTSLPMLLFSQSAPKLVQALSRVQYPSDFTNTFAGFVQKLFHSEYSDPEKLATLMQLLPADPPAATIESLQKSSQMQALILSTCRSDAAAQATQAIRVGLVSQETTLQCIEIFATGLGDDSTIVSSLKSLETIASRDRALMVNDNIHLIAHILELRDNLDEQVSSLAKLLSSRLTVHNEGSDQHGTDIVRRAIQNEKLTVDGVMELAATYLGIHISMETLVSCVPLDENWEQTLRSSVHAPDQSLSICSPLGGAVRFVQATQPQTQSEALSDYLHVALCVSQLLSKVKSDEQSSVARVFDILQFCTMILAIADDLPSLTRPVSVLGPGESTSEDVAASLTSVTSFVQRMSPETFGQLVAHIPAYPSDDLSAYSYYTSLIKLRWLASRDDQSVYVKKTFYEDAELFSALTQMSLFDLAAMLACEQPATANDAIVRQTNLLVSSITESNLAVEDRTTQRQILTLSLCLATSESVVSSVAKQRLVFLVQHLLKSLSTDVPPAQCENALKILTLTLPGLSDMYGQHWTDSIEMIVAVWRTGHDLPSLYASLRLYNKLDQLSRGEDANEDLVEVLRDRSEVLSSELINLLISTGQASSNSQPFFLFCALLSRTISTLGTVPSTSSEDLYPLLHAKAISIQQAAFILLRKQIRSSVEAVSIDAALEKKTARMPNALLSSILAAPSTSEHEESPELHAYLNSWRLIFDHMLGASYKVQIDYAEQLRVGEFVNSLMTTVFAGLGMLMGKPADLLHYNPAHYEGDPDPVKDKQWLLAHLYYMSLRYLPSIVKTCMLELKARHLPAVVQSWTAKYISPLLIAESLEEVSKWAKTTVDEDPEYEKMQVTIGTKSKEIGVKYVVDEQTMAIKVILPEAYPLVAAQVVGINRVAVNEDKWQSWLRNCQGVITFSNGNITDGLNAWRRNVTGALKGQTECAICYSIISAERQLPNKRCPTCKNLFHSGCLFKWFKTSNASTCPLCRNPFNFN